MFDTVNGLPIHPLVVHAVVVLLPLAVLGTVALVLRPAWRERYGVLLVLVTAAATALVPVATQSGEALEKHVGDPGRHAELGDQLLWFALPLLVCVTLFVGIDRRTGLVDTGGDSGSAAISVRRVVGALAVVAALATGVQVYRVGDSGARAAWGDQVTATPGGHG